MKFYFDTAIFIYALEVGSATARNTIETAVTMGTVGTSVVTLMEYCTGCLKHARPEMAQLFRHFLTDLCFEIHDIKEETAFLAADIRAKYPAFKQMDALQLASAVSAKANIFYTNDKQLLQFSHNHTKVVRPDL